MLKFDALGGTFLETYQNHRQKMSSRNAENGRLRRMPGFLSVRVQNVVHGRKPEMRETGLTF